MGATHTYEDRFFKYDTDTGLLFFNIHGDWVRSKKGRFFDMSKLKPIWENANEKHVDNVNNPQHYQFFGGIEAIEIIASCMTSEQFLGYCLGNKLKYRLRAGDKDNAEQDIAKSNKYVELYLKHKHLCRVGK